MYVSVYIVYHIHSTYRYKYQKCFYPIKGCVGGVLSRVLNSGRQLCGWRVFDPGSGH